MTTYVLTDDKIPVLVCDDLEKMEDYIVDYYNKTYTGKITKSDIRQNTAPTWEFSYLISVHGLLRVYEVEAV